MNIYDGCEQAYKNGQNAALSGNYDLYNQVIADKDKYYSPTICAYIKGFNSVKNSNKVSSDKYSEKIED